MVGRYVPKPEVTSFPNDREKRFDGMIVLPNEIKSICSHHHQPVTGIAYIGILPAYKLIGLSKYSRIV
jgi:GTP cyclohydrolase I